MYKFCSFFFVFMSTHTSHEKSLNFDKCNSRVLKSMVDTQLMKRGWYGVKMIRGIEFKMEFGMNLP